MARRRFVFLIWLLVLLSASPRCVGQKIKIRIINGSNGRPLSKQQVSVSLLYEKTEKPQQSTRPFCTLKPIQMAWHSSHYRTLPPHICRPEPI